MIKILCVGKIKESYLNDLIQTCNQQKTVDDLDADKPDANSLTLDFPVSLGQAEYADGLRNSLQTEQELAEYLNYYYTNKKGAYIYIGVTINSEENKIILKKVKNIGELGGCDYRIPIHGFDKIEMLPSEDIYSYSLYSCIIIAKSVLSNNEIQQWFEKHEDLGKEFFNIDTRGQSANSVDVYDAIEIARGLLPKYYNAKTFKQVRNLN